MSLIQEALKRQAEENAGMRLPGQPAIEPPTPPGQVQHPEKKKTKAFPVVPFVLFLMVFLAVLLGLSIYLIKPKLKTSPKAVQKSESVIPAPVVISSIPEPVKVPEEPMPTVEAIIEQGTPPVVEEPAVSSESVLKIKKSWPELKLTGIAQGGDRQRLAILNGKMLSAGRNLGEVIVIQVRDNSVLVEYRGERRNLYIGE